MTATNLTDNGSTTKVKTRGGNHVLAVTGTFGSGTVTLEFSPDGGTTWVSTGVTRTAAGFGSVLVAPGHLRATLAGATTPNLNVYVSPKIL